MTIQTWDPNRIGGGTIELIQDPTTGIFTTNEVGFVKLPNLTLPAIDQAAYDAPAPDPDPDSDPCPDGYKLVDGVCQLIDTSSGGDGGGGSGGGGYSGGSGDTYYDTRTQEMLEKAGGTYPGGYHSAEGGFEYTGTPPYLDIDRDTRPTPSGSDRGPLDDPDRFGSYPLASDRGPLDDPDRFGSPVQKKEILYIDSTGQKYYKAPEKFQPITNTKTDSVTQEPKGGVARFGTVDRRLSSRPSSDRGPLDAPDRYGPPVSTFGELEPIYQGIAPKPGGTILEDEFKSTPRSVKGTLVGDQFFPDTLTTPDLKGVKEVGKDLITTKLKDTLKTNVTELVETGKKSLKIVPITARIMGGALDALFGVTDEDRMRQTENKNALTSLGYKTVGGNVDAGRIAGNPADNVFAGKNMVSAKGDIMQGARNRVSTRNSSKTQARISKLSPERQKAFNDKTEEFQKQINAAQDKKNKQALAKGGVAPGASGGSGDGGGCFLKGTQVTMLNGSTKVIEQVDLGDNVAKGGKVFAVGRFLINNLYDYKGIKVSGSHMVNEDDKWIRIEDSKHGKALGNDEHTVYVFGSENRRILINDILFTDYFEVTDQEKLLKYEDKFFDNWGIYSKNEDTNNINILNAS